MQILLFHLQGTLASHNSQIHVFPLHANTCKYMQITCMYTCKYKHKYVNIQCNGREMHSNKNTCIPHAQIPNIYDFNFKYMQMQANTQIYFHWKSCKYLKIHANTWAYTLPIGKYKANQCFAKTKVYWKNMY